jgi:UDP-2,4-diacetamido-2,4,6-trideoxy-beta-L-altropyranose hydrolase
VSGSDTELKLREAVAADVTLLFNWANDEEVRNNSISQEPIIWDNHVNWFNSRLIDPNTKMLILESNYVPVGQMRLVLLDGCWTINYSIDKSYRGKGYGKKIVLLSLEKHPSVPFRAVVKKSNIASQKVFEDIGFISEYSTDENLCLYEYKPGTNINTKNS